MRVLVSWSSGKDSAWTLYSLRRRPDIEVCGLITTFNSAADRVAMHAVRRSLVEMQSERAGLPLWPVELPWPCSNPEYEFRMRAVCDRATAEGVEAIAFGDLFLEDIRRYRIQQLESTCLEPLFPLWLMMLGSAAYDPEKQALDLRFRNTGDVYRHFDVPASEYHAFLAGASGWAQFCTPGCIGSSIRQEIS